MSGQENVQVVQPKSLTIYDQVEINNINDYMTANIFACLCCCWPIGIAAIMKSNEGVLIPNYLEENGNPSHHVIMAQVGKENNNNNTKCRHAVLGKCEESFHHYHRRAGSRIFRRGSVDPFGGFWPPTWALFSDNVCKNERIGSCRGACAGHAPPRSAYASLLVPLRLLSLLLRGLY